ncbi:MAG: peptidoglycan editing factor PgeF [Prevotella sp.]|uniref:peptidoglycan editing factor PgeF n=1 Tax=Prevotella sp. TaxID=59823 RepID=UPI002A330709|nr:peptidoglycan editing factor PgeF [Prevotella sp.]MDD7318922.1 peptidoglycan editing factor PgeF [Prevotellaceae bacterium]MDY4019948.1 peptidoglycan editing factor PgeF [Prevotella sp.]
MRLHEYLLGDGVRAFSTMRTGGVSTGNHASFNINRHCGDSEESISSNRALLARELGVAAEDILYPLQVHGSDYKIVTTELLSLDADGRQAYIDGCDALITDIANVCIGVSTADCIPIVIYDREHHCAAVVHAGWRGTVKRIAEVVVAAMGRHFASRPEMLRAAIGPGISLAAFEVGDEVYETFLAAHFPMQKIAKRYPPMDTPDCERHKDAPKWHIDLPACNRLQLIDAGLTDENILSSGICTYHNSADFFSARRLGTESGRVFTAALLT